MLCEEAHTDYFFSRILWCSVFSYYTLNSFHFLLRDIRSGVPLSEREKRLEKTDCNLCYYFPIFSRFISSILLNYIGFLSMI